MSCCDFYLTFPSSHAGETALTLILRRCAADSADGRDNGFESRREGGADDSDDDRSFSIDGESAGESESKSKGRGKGRGRGRGSSASSYQQWAIAAELLVRSGAGHASILSTLRPLDFHVTYCPVTDSTMPVAPMDILHSAIASIKFFSSLYGKETHILQCNSIAPYSTAL